MKPTREFCQLPGLLYPQVTSGILTGQSGAPMTLCTGRSQRFIEEDAGFRPSCPLITQADIAAVLEVLNSPSLSLGPKLAAFERAMAEYSVYGLKAGGCCKQRKRPGFISVLLRPGSSPATR